MSETPETQYVAVTEIIPNTPVFGKTVWASDKLSAMTQFDLMNESYEEVWLYVDDNQLYLVDDE